MDAAGGAGTAGAAGAAGGAAVAGAAGAAGGIEGAGTLATAPPPAARPFWVLLSDRFTGSSSISDEDVPLDCDEIGGMSA